jgi:hypothetical protein
MSWSCLKTIVCFNAFSLGLATTAQAVLNPAACPSSDGYSVTEPVIANQALVIVLTAITSGQQIMLYVLSSICAVNGRPLVTTVQLQ